MNVAGLVCSEVGEKPPTRPQYGTATVPAHQRQYLCVATFSHHAGVAKYLASVWHARESCSAKGDGLAHEKSIAIAKGNPQMNVPALFILFVAEADVAAPQLLSTQMHR